MTFGSYISNGFRFLTFKADAVHSVRDDENSFRYGLGILTAVSLLVFLAFGALGSLVVGLFAGGTGFASGWVFGVVAGIFTFVLGFVGPGIIHLCARLFGGKARVTQYFSVVMAMTIPSFIISIILGILNVIPFLGVLLSLIWDVYAFIIGVFLVRETYTMSTLRAVFAVLLPVIVVFILFVAFFASLMPFSAMSGLP